ncbi:uncharacterized protein LOC107267462 isoform X1 [Cephus cinctus]|uniref:Uncharacterized protein LOC107267462 isoform X1 n=1 Tax=Cephus cinctus TaxID=211228 RepID=A0AAJ7BV64_CEPCN|nr:uncharacterized protein LOC107267462 isoform X1 [Cephus cinctus]
MNRSPKANRSFLHGSSSKADQSSNKVAYATLDSLALRRTRLPLCLVPIDESHPNKGEKVEKEEKKEKRNVNRKKSSRQPSFKIRSGASTQWKHRATRSSGKVHNVFLRETCIGTGNIANGVNVRLQVRQGFAKNGSRVQIQRIPETVPELLEQLLGIQNNENIAHKNSNRSKSIKKCCSNVQEDGRVGFKILDRAISNYPENKVSKVKNNIQIKSLERSPTKYVPDEVIIKSEKLDQHYEEFKNPLAIVNCGKRSDCDIKEPEQKNDELCSSVSQEKNNHEQKFENSDFKNDQKLFDTKKRSDLGFAKNVFNYVPMTSRTKSLKKLKKKTVSTDTLKTKSHSLKSLTISEPSNFVHIASATNSKLLNAGKTFASSQVTEVITHKEKCATLPLLVSTNPYSSIDFINLSSDDKSANNTKDIRLSEDSDKTNYVEIRSKEPLKRTYAIDKLSSSLEKIQIDKREVDQIYECISRFSTGNTASALLPSLDATANSLPLNLNQESNINTDSASPISTNCEGSEEKIYETVFQSSSASSSSPVNVSTPVGVNSILHHYTEAESHYADLNLTTVNSALVIRANSSFLWGSMTTGRSGVCVNVQNVNSSAFDNKSPMTVLKSDDSSSKSNRELTNTVNNEDYDDVGLTDKFTNDYEYDDVGPPGDVIIAAEEIKNQESVNSATVKVNEKFKNYVSVNDDNEEVYDDVVVLNYDSTGNLSSSSTQAESSSYMTPYLVTRKASFRHKDQEVVLRNAETQYLIVNNEYSSVEDEPEAGLYDDIDLLSQERVNSLYAGSSAGSQLGSTSNGKDSEWEDLDDTPPALPLPRRNGPRVIGEVQNITLKKKLGPRWYRNVRKQRSKTSRKSSTKSLNQVTQDSISVDATSDDSNYETLYSSQVDEFSTDSESESFNKEQNLTSTGILYEKRNYCNNNNDNKLDVRKNSEVKVDEAPLRPTPPTPREPSITQTLGRRMKILRRTWSFTKGSLGRMRKRTEPETSFDETPVKQQNINDARKYFSFKKHFRKSITGLSTFYLENSTDSNYLREEAPTKEEIYANANLYTRAGLWKDDNQSVEDDVSTPDHYSVLAEEPLYQFYAAAVARVAFESDSDGYEEVNDVTPSPATTDLGKPGHRTLWCQTPQVIHSGLLQRLTMEERKIQEAKFEILTSEASYLNSLRVLENEFASNYELNNEILTTLERNKLFGGLSAVRMTSEKLLTDLENIWRDDPLLGDLPDALLKHAEKCSTTYIQYCSNQVTIDTVLKELRTRKGSKFVEVISNIEAHPACQSLSLHSFLMLPMQRITRLPLLADAVLSKLPTEHTERSVWESVLARLTQVVADCNEGARVAGQRVEMDALARKLEYSAKVTPVSLRDKYLVRSGAVVQLSGRTDAEYRLTFGKKFHKTPLYIFLLTDYLLVSKPKISAHDETYTVIDTCKRNLVALETASEDSLFAGRNAMILTLLENYQGREAEYVVTCDSDTERQRWLDAVSSPKSELVGERLYESWDCPQVMALYSYSPRQPDELALQPGDVINVLRKMIDGWHHGEKLLDGEQGWFPGNYTKEVASEHVRARNLRQRHRILALSGNILQRRAKRV